MLRLPIFKPLVSGLTKSHFFNNSNIISLTKNGLKQKNLPSQTKFLKSNVSILKSSMIPSFSKGFKSESLSRSFIRFKSNTWSNYNKHYGRSNWNKLKSPALFTVAFCVGTTLVIPYVFDYTPLSYLKKNPKALVYGIIAINGAVFLMWRSPQFAKFLTRYGLLMKDNIYSNWSLLGCAFSHQELGHLFVNMFVLSSFGTTLCAMIGPANFLIMYLNSAVFSSFVSLLIPTLLRSSLGVASLGASGAVFAVVAAFSYLIPNAPIAFFFIPVPGGAWLAFLGTVGWNIAGAIFKWGRFDYAAHLGGSIIGVAYGWWYTKKIKDARRNRQLRWG